MQSLKVKRLRPLTAVQELCPWTLLGTLRQTPL